MKELDAWRQRWLAKCIKETGHTEDFEALLAHGGVKLLEVSRGPASLLNAKMAEKCGQGAVRRISSWKGRKLGTLQGNQDARDVRDSAGPDHLWVSIRCGPLSNLSVGPNEADPQKAEAARKHRLQVIKEYKGAVLLVYNQVAQGKHAHCCLLYTSPSPRDS